MVFYADYPVKKYSKMGIKPEKLFVANNTVQVLPCESKEKDSLLFIGSLYKQKKIDVLLNAYLGAYYKNMNIPKLIIIGEGAEKPVILDWIKKNNLENKILLAGGIYDDEILADYFASAIICISPDQAGLSVLKSMGYGVPYITHKDAITGGEIFNIHSGIDGLLMNDFGELESLILECTEDKEK